MYQKTKIQSEFAYLVSNIKWKIWTSFNEMFYVLIWLFIKVFVSGIYTTLIHGCWVNSALLSGST